MARNNYKSEKRRKELKRQKKNDEKRLRKLEKKEPLDGEDAVSEGDETEPQTDPA